MKKILLKIEKFIIKKMEKFVIKYKNKNIGLERFFKEQRRKKRINFIKKIILKKPLK